jgi:hypothetical protein
MARPNTEILEPPPWWFVWLIVKLTPQTGGNARGTFLLDGLWESYPSVFRVIPPLVPQLASAVVLRSIKRFSLKMAAAQLCVLIWFGFFADQHSWAMVLLLGLMFVGFLIREAYVVLSERLWHEIVTALLIAPAIVFLDSALGLISPRLMTPLEPLMPLLGAASIVIAICRYHMAPEVGPEHPYKEILRHHHRTWYFNDFWLILWSGYLLTVELSAPAKWAVQGWLTITPSMMCFSTAIRLQLNPIGGNYRHQIVKLKLFTDPYQDDVKMKADYLLVGADWFGKLCLQSVLEILAFAFSLAPLVIAAIEWHTGDPNAARFCGVRLTLSVIAWVALFVTWPLIKKLNRRTRKVLDQTIQTFRQGSEK